MLPTAGAGNETAMNETETDIKHNGTGTGLRSDLRALPRGAWILFFGTFLNKFGAFVLPFLAIYMTRLGFKATEAGLAIGAYGIGSLCASFLGGSLADRIGRRKTIVLSMFSGAITMVCLSQARSLNSIVVLSCLAGLTGELYRPASSALLTDLVPSGQRVTAFAAYRMAFNAGFAFGPATAGFLAKYSFTWLFIGDAATSVLYGIVAWFALPAGLRGQRAENSVIETFRVVRDNPHFRRLLCSALVAALVFVQTFSTLSMVITKNGFAPSLYGVLISFNGLLVVLCELPITSVTRRFPVRRMIALGFLLIGAGFASNAIERTVPLLFLTMMIITFGEMLAMPLTGAFVADLAPSHQRGLYMGTYGLVWSVAFVCGPGLGLMLFAVSPVALWMTCGALGLLAAAIIAD